MTYNRLTPIFSNPPLAVTGDITHFSKKISFATDCLNAYDKDLSKSTSGKPSRQSLAFFVPDTDAASQAVIMQSRQAHTCLLRGKTNHDGLTLQNKPKGEYAGRLLVEPRVRPITLYRFFYRTYSANLTQKTTRGYHA